MTDPAVEAAGRALVACRGHGNSTICEIESAREALKPLRELHRPRWDNCINACCSGEQCKHRTRSCEGGCDEYVNDEGDYWPCATARLVYSSDELDELT